MVQESSSNTHLQIFLLDEDDAHADGAVSVESLLCCKVSAVYSVSFAVALLEAL